MTRAALSALEEAEREGEIWCSDISLWEIAMLIERGRIIVDDPRGFVSRLRVPRGVRVQPITEEIALLSGSLGLHRDPADRLIAATAVHLGATLITSDGLLRSAPGVRTVW